MSNWKSQSFEKGRGSRAAGAGLRSVAQMECAPSTTTALTVIACGQ